MLWKTVGAPANDRQVTCEERGFELCQCTYMWIFYQTVFPVVVRNWRRRGPTVCIDLMPFYPGDLNVHRFWHLWWVWEPISHRHWRMTEFWVSQTLYTDSQLHKEPVPLTLAFPKSKWHKICKYFLSFHTCLFILSMASFSGRSC